MTFQVTIEPDGRRFRTLVSETLLEAARRNGIALPYECGWGHCGSCKVTVVEGQTDLMFPAAPALTPRDQKLNRTVACQAIACSDLVIKLSPGEPQSPAIACRTQEAELVAVEELAPEIRRFTLRPEGGADFLPGQYAILHLGDRLRRAYSMCNLPDGETLQVISKRYPGGAGSNALAVLQPGDRLTLESPFGTCTLKPRPGRKIFIAGGTGISPILSLVRQAARDSVDFAAPVDIVYCARRVADLAASDELAEAAAAIAGATYTPCVEEETSQPDHATGRALDVLASLAYDPAATEFYVAGPPVMVNAVKSHLKEAGVAITRIHYDSFG
ncbi:2Fe-2S iron-sulfur cluster-binding protein [Rhizobium sp. C1]|uniref:2Fe-2S iron-sulfur cluster-binding protein n=1 Tax=Rhizobium sp. C1 TaxID=1349799 RepID=UPI001E3E82B6|nr:2Fe-2S iron-sulfur cluster binding domain-containing protein [Rhizobium sp. C1]MCD2178695.1 2Fe-2S iron-sulfur cluster binding domain-containing protein [Rhizobium sp. C1]